jgi:hypothetical protein
MVQGLVFVAHPLYIQYIKYNNVSEEPSGSIFREEEFMNFIVWRFHANGKLIVWLASFDLIILNIFHQMIFMPLKLIIT